MTLARRRRLPGQLALGAAALALSCRSPVETAPPPPNRPSIASVSPDSVTEGYGTFELTVEGTGFAAGAVIQWQGSARATRVESATRAVATILAADVAQPTHTEISVRNPAPDSATSYPQPFRVVVPAVTRAVTLPFLGQDVLYDPRRGLLYASAAAPSASDSGRLLVIDPVAGTVVSSRAIKPDPGALALSDDGRFLYVAVNGASLVRRLDLDSAGPPVDIPMGGDQFGAFGVGDIVVLAGAPRSIAVSRLYAGTVLGFKGVAVFDDTVQRPDTAATYCDRIERSGSASLLYGWDSHSNFGVLHWLDLTPTGVVDSRQAGDLVSHHANDITWYGGRIYGGDGSVVDPETATVIARLFRYDPSPQPRAMAPDSTSRRLFVGAVITNTTMGYLEAYDLSALTYLGMVDLPASSASYLYPQSLRRWGDYGFAYVTGSEIVIVETTLVRPRAFP